jgi:hypothetical protein
MRLGAKMILIREKRLKMDIYEAKRQQVLDEIKKLEGSFPKKESSLSGEQLKKIKHHAEKFGHTEEEVLESILRDFVAYRAIVGKDPSRMDYYETALVEYLLKQPQVRKVQKLPKGGKNSYHIDKGKIVQGKKTKLVKSLDLLVEFNNGETLWIIHKFTKEGGGAQDAAFRDAELTLQQVIGSDGKTLVNVAAVLDGEYYKQKIEGGTLTRLEKAARDASNSIVATYDGLIKASRHLWNK